MRESLPMVRLGFKLEGKEEHNGPWFDGTAAAKADLLLRAEFLVHYFAEDGVCWLETQLP